MTKEVREISHLVINVSLVIEPDIGQKTVQREGLREEADHLRGRILIEEKVGALFVKERDI